MKKMKKVMALLLSLVMVLAMSVVAFAGEAGSSAAATSGTYTITAPAGSHKYEIYQIMIDLVKQGKSIIMISSEMPELIGMSNRIIVMCNGHITGEVEGEEATQERIMSFATQFDLQGKSTTESK